MNVAALLARLGRADIKLSVADGKLAFDAPAGAFSAELRDEVVANKGAIIAFLGQAQAEAGNQIVARAPGTDAPLSFQQQRLWFLDMLEGPSAVYNMPLAVDIEGTLDVAALHGALSAIVERHAVLRSAFVAGPDGPLQHVRAPGALALPLIDLTHLAPAARAAESERRRRVEAETPFALDGGALLRASLLVLGPQSFRLLLSMHHAASDGWSLAILVEEISALYLGAVGAPAPTLAPLPYQYADFALWQRQALAGDALAHQLDYWRTQLAGMDPLLELPTDHARPARQCYDGGAVDVKLPRALTEALKALARSQGATLYMVLLAAFNVLLARYARSNDIAVGTSIANRRFPELEKLIGFFVNTLVLRVDSSGNPPFLALLERTKQVVLGAYACQDVPFEQVVDALQLPRNLSHAPLVQVMFDLQNMPSGKAEWPGVAMTVLAPERRSAKFDLTMALSDTGDGLAGHIEYSSALFERATMARLAGHFTTLLEAIVQAPATPIAALGMLTATEYQTVVHDWNATARHYPGAATLHRRFEAQAAAYPQHVAACDSRASITYAELDLRAGRLAAYLQAQGIAPGMLVAICAERSLDMVVAMLATLKVGAAYVPMDSAYPLERLRYMLADADAPMLLTQSWLRAKLAPPDGSAVFCLDGDWAGVPALPCASAELDGAACAYMMYTSGSTGAPKGALVSHAGALNHIDAEADLLGFKGPFHFLQSAPASSDISVWQFLGPLMTGGKTVIVDDVTDAANLHAVIRREQLHLVELVPVVTTLLIAHLRGLPEAARAMPSLRYLMATGEAVPVELVNDWLALYPQIPVINAYGPTEAADDVTQFMISAALPPGQGSVPIGKPLPNMRIYILDEADQPQPVGVPGEICVAGVGVGHGYWRKPELTRERFVDDPFASVPGQKLYRTGDLGRWRADGNIDYIKRKDHQVKIRGFRIELGEIEASLRKFAGVEEAVVVVADGRAGDQLLVAYVTVAQLAQFEPGAAKTFLAERLPLHMVPAGFVRLEAFPLLPNGKLDRKTLPPYAPDASAALARVAPRTPVETALAAIWCEVLALDAVGVTENFFDLGGHSISATQLVARVRKQMHTDLPLREVFLHPTIAAQAVALVELQLGAADADDMAQLLSSLDGLSEAELEQMLLEQQA